LENEKSHISKKVKVICAMDPVIIQATNGALGLGRSNPNPKVRSTSHARAKGQA
jgi:hypothetical protein